MIFEISDISLQKTSLTENNIIMFWKFILQIEGFPAQDSKHVQQPIGLTCSLDPGIADYIHIVCIPYVNSPVGRHTGSDHLFGRVSVLKINIGKY